MLFGVIYIMLFNMFCNTQHYIVFPPQKNVKKKKEKNPDKIPSGQRPSASYVMSSLAEKQSCSSMTSTLAGFRPAASKHFLAAKRVMS